MEKSQPTTNGSTGQKKEVAIGWKTQQDRHLIRTLKKREGEDGQSRLGGLASLADYKNYQFDLGGRQADSQGQDEVEELCRGPMLLKE